MDADFNALESQLVGLARRALELPIEEAEYSASECADLAMRPLEERLADPRKAFNYAAQQVGEAMIALAGFKSLHDMFDRIECHAGERVANWVCRSWVGLRSPDGKSTWTD